MAFHPIEPCIQHSFLLNLSNETPSLNRSFVSRTAIAMAVTAAMDTDKNDNETMKLLPLMLVARGENNN